MEGDLGAAPKPPRSRMQEEGTCVAAGIELFHQSIAIPSTRVNNGNYASQQAGALLRMLNTARGPHLYMCENDASVTQKIDER